MKKAVVILLLGLVLLIIQETARYYSRPSLDVVPNLLIILVVLLAFHELTVLGAVLTFFLGVQYDIAAGTGVIGPWAGAFVAVFFLTGVLSQRIFSESGLSVIFATALATGLSAVIYHLINFKVSTHLPSSSKTILLEALLTAIVGPFLLRILKGPIGVRKRPRHW